MHGCLVSFSILQGPRGILTELAAFEFLTGRKSGIGLLETQGYTLCMS